MKANFMGINDKKGEQFLRHNECDIINGQYGYYTEPKKKGECSVFIPCGSAVEVVEVLINLESMKRKLKIRTYDCIGYGTEIDMPRSSMTEQGILSLTDYGVQVDKKSAGVLLKCIENEEMNAPQIYEHSDLGFARHNEEIIFKGYKALEIESNYVGGLEIKPHGSFKRWKKMVREEVLGTEMEVVLATALSATVLDFIHNEYPVDNILMSLVGNSSSGKTTALNLAVSAGALPATAKKSLLLSFVDTELSIVHRIPSSFPVGIDEYSAADRNITKLIYTLANGSERNRMNKDLSMADTRDFHTAIFTSSECSILDSACKYEGLRARVMEFYDISWTTSGESADKIKTVCLSNYGWAVPKMAEYLLGVDKGSLIDVCEEWAQSYRDKRTDENALAVRMAKKVGIIMATAIIAEEALGIQFDLDMIEDFFVENLLPDPGEYDIGVKAYEAIIAYYIQKPLEFGDYIRDASKDLKELPDVYYKSGKVLSDYPKTLFDGTQSESVLFIEKQKFHRILADNKFKDSRVILNRLIDLGLLEPDSDRKTWRVCLGNGKVRTTGYKLRLPDGYLPAPKKYKKQKKNK